MTFPGLLDFSTHLNFPLRHPFGGGSICLGLLQEPSTGLSAYMHAAKSDGVGWGWVGVTFVYHFMCYDFSGNAPRA